VEPIYRTDGEWVAVYVDGHIFSVEGDWLGFVVGRRVFDTGGKYMGFLSDDRRLLRKRTLGKKPVHHDPPPAPETPRIPASMPLAPLFPEVPFNVIDVFEEFGDTLFYISETRPDME
jgi:hypothetical protein